MKTVSISTLIMLLCIGMASAQSKVVEKSFRIANDKRVILDLPFGDEIQIKAWDKQEVSFQAVIEINGGRLNDALELKFDDTSSWLRIKTDYDKKLIKQGKKGDCPNQGYGSYWNGNDQSYLCTDVFYTIYVPRKADLKIETISADIELNGVNGPLDVKSISGFVDITWDEKNGADLYLKTISGDAFTDLATLHSNENRRFSSVGIDMKTKINGGGNRLNLETISGDIFLRKKK